MKRKILSFMLAFVCIITCGLCLTACGNKGNVENAMNIQQNLPDKVHVEYGNVVYVKDGNDIYAKSEVYSMSGRHEVYVRENLSDGVFYWQGEGQHFISARWDEYNNCWENADDDTYHQDNGWIANDQNHSVIGGVVKDSRGYNYGPYSSAYMLHGYSDVNSQLDTMTITKLENETITLESGQQIACEVWQTVFEYDGSYEKCKYWFAADSHIYLKGLWTQERNADIDVAGSKYNMPEATYYAVGENMDDFLQSLSPARTKPDFSAWQ